MELGLDLTVDCMKTSAKPGLSWNADTEYVSKVIVQFGSILTHFHIIMN